MHGGPAVTPCQQGQGDESHDAFSLLGNMFFSKWTWQLAGLNAQHKCSYEG